MILFDLSGKIAVVTGSTRGIGFAIARQMGLAGAHVVISSEDEADVEMAVAALSAEGLAVSGLRCDVTQADDLAALVDHAVALGGLDILVCNAGITGGAGDNSLDDFDQVMGINLRSMVALTTLALPHLAARAGAVVLISSLSALRGNATINAYALAKAGVSQLARNIAVQWGPKGVRANAIAPGLIRTELSGPLMANAAFMERRMQMTPLRRMGTVEEVAGAAVFLASAAGGYVTGQTLVVDGGTLVTDGS
jgi:NAD(P)-dependent dehydrogenase (short-subunit alcohol dehydrogenase family)